MSKLRKFRNKNKMKIQSKLLRINKFRKLKKFKVVVHQLPKKEKIMKMKVKDNNISNIMKFHKIYNNVWREANSLSIGLF